jgi:arylsulfatase A-like enzyme
MPIPPTYVPAAKIQTPKIPRKVYNGQFIPGYNYVKSPAGLREHEVRECQTIAGIDKLVGRVVAELQRQGVADNTIIVYFSDHGIQHGEFGLGGKVLLYEPSIRVPLVIYDPRLPKSRHGARMDRMALSIDIAPTLLDLCGVESPDGIQGRSLAPLMRGEPVEWRDDFFLENMFMGQNYPRMEGVRSERYKYIRYFDKKRDQHHFDSLTASLRGEPPIYEELFDLAKDPHEMQNLAGNDRYTKTLDESRQRCRELLIEAKGGDDPPATHVQGRKIASDADASKSRRAELGAH